MSSARLPQLGSVVWAELEDANGFRKVRPALVINATADILRGGSVHALAITTRLPNPLPDDYVLLPWDRQVCGSRQLADRNPARRRARSRWYRAPGGD